MPAAASTALMNRIYRRQRHIYDVTRKYFLLGRDLLIERLDAPTGANVLEIGCGTGRNLVMAARRFPKAQFFGIDISTEMLTSAHDTIAYEALASRIRVAHADATNFDPVRLFGIAKFERIFVSYSLSMIPDWTTVIHHAVSRLAQGGELHIVDFGSQSRLPRLFGSGLRRWLSLFHVTPRDRLEDFLAELVAADNLSWCLERPYRDYVQYCALRLTTSKNKISTVSRDISCVETHGVSASRDRL